MNSGNNQHNSPLKKLCNKNTMLALGVVAVVLAGGIGFVAGSKHGMNASSYSSSITSSDAIIVATVNGKAITLNQVQSYLSAISPYGDLMYMSLAPEIQTQIARDVYVSEMLYQRAKTELRNNPLALVALETKTYLMYAQEFLNFYAESRINESDMRMAYDKMQEELANEEEYSVSHILVESQKEADDIYKEITDNKLTFEQAADKYSLDQVNAKNGGNIGFFMMSQVDPAFAIKVENLPLNQVSEPFETQYGWHIAKVLEKRKVEIPPYEQVTSNLREKIKQEIISEYTNSMIEGVQVELKVKSLQTEQPAGEYINQSEMNNPQ